MTRLSLFRSAAAAALGLTLGRGASPAQAGIVLKTGECVINPGRALEKTQATMARIGAFRRQTDGRSDSQA